MAKIIYLEDTITLLANKGGIELVKLISKQGEFKQTETGYRYIVIETETKDTIWTWIIVLLMIGFFGFMAIIAS